ncbi:autophagy-related protein 13 homolog isoform X2 [Bradysia coprophila]|uniref:autophagy-related protein 13 homolog isoform X2 n=1 Tax=Bradysia coprophila TaxID=38358 RepID=UPI00187D8ED6|nr:autophagy-related protein 13 homolog isoform X2 [Bradysia coprophila]
MLPNIQDKRELDRYLKFLVLKSAQVIVQSRLGEKIRTECYIGQNHWFNVAIQDQPDVLLETKRVLDNTPGDTTIAKFPLCVEITLETVEGDKMSLEVWSLNIISDQNDPLFRAHYGQTYNGMSILLKSLIAVTRATPAYKLSRKQSPDSYNIFYRVYAGEPLTHNLGEGFKQVRVGQLGTAAGTLSMAVAYRTKMTISPTQTGRDNTIMLKSDHFLKDLSPKNIRYHHANKKNEKKVIDLDKPLKPGAFVDTSKIKQYTEEDFILPETPPFSWLLRKTKEEELGTSPKSDDESQIKLGVSPSKTDISMNNNTVPLRGSGEAIAKSNSPPSSVLDSKRSFRGGKKLPPEDERLMKELHFPFATPNTPMNDLAKFYRDCFNAPPLQEFTHTPVEEEVTVDDLTMQLEQFETSLGDYDALVTSICSQSVDNNSNS